MLRGLDPTGFSVEDNALLYLGLSSYIAPTRGKQDEEGNMFRKLIDSYLPPTPSHN
jgi:hypothetical protein